MRTNADENFRMGEIFAEKANAAKGPVAFLIPTKGLSILDSIDADGKEQLFWNPEADQAFTDGLQSKLNTAIPVYFIDADINDAAFSCKAVECFMELQGMGVGA